MFGNFLYFIVALLIYATYQPPARPQLPLSEALGFFIALSALFAILTRIVFKKLEDRLSGSDPGEIDRAFESLLTRQTILAIGLFAVDIYGLELGGHLQRLALVEMIPTLGALVSLCVFVGYLCIIWASAHSLHERLYRTGISRRSYIASNISFSVPVLLPWLCLSTVADLVNLLPFEAPRAFLNATEGQVAYFLFFLFAIAVFGPALIQQFWGCKPLAPSDARQRIEALFRRAGVSYREILVWPLFGGRMITAGVLGLVSRFRYILVTPALMRYLTPPEIEAVMAHEIGHVKQKHLLFYLVFFAGYLIVSFAVLDLVLFATLYVQILAGVSGRGDPAGPTLVSIAFSIAMISVFLVYFRFVFGYFMRNFERQADIYVYRLTDSAAALISTFYKIAASSGQSPERPNWHHFSISERIAYLRKCEADPAWIRSHNRKVRASIAVYVVGMLLALWIGYSLHYGTAGQAVSGRIAQRLIAQQIERSPDNPELRVMLGDLFYSRNDPESAETAYRQALALDPDNVRALNNLAWLYATAPRQSPLFRPEKAMELAKRAARQSQQPHVLDTLAECYFVNGRYEKAVEIGKRALSASSGDRAYYREQLEKFQKASSFDFSDRP